MIFDHNSYGYMCRFLMIGKNKFNGAYYYSKEIVENIIPNIETSYNWVTINAAGKCWDHSIVFIHDNQNPKKYEWLRHYKDLVLVCGVKSTVANMQKLLPQHRSIYLPLSVDVKSVEKHKVEEKTGEEAFAGRLCKQTSKLPKGIYAIGDMPREELLDEMAKYKKIYAVGRTAIEAKILGCEIVIYDPRYPKDIWKVIDNSEVVPILQKML